MASLTDRKFSFTSSALAPDTFTVVSFTGNEGLSVPYRFEVLLAAENHELDLDRVINHPARFVIHRESGDDVFFNGILSEFEQLQSVETWAFYRAILVPRLWWLSLTHHNQVFLDNSVPEILEAVLNDGGLTALDFALRLEGQYAKRDYVCQYGETHLDFLARWMAREGIYYYFEQSESAEKLVITDTALAHGENRRGGVLTYSPASGLADAHRQEIVQAIVCHVALLPSTVRLKDYNYRKPSLEMTGSADVDANGRGEVYIYGEHFRTAEEGDRLAAIRAEALRCRRREFIGDSTVPYLQPGYTFSLTDHYRPNFNAGYLTIEMAHEGSQTGYLIAGLRQALSDREQGVYYRNRFTAIPSGVQFRPAPTLSAAKITGTLNAHIDGSGDGQYAELDEQGRYKVILPFDTSGRKDGKASAWLRMIQPYAGADHGMHFPLHKGTEVLLTFIEGNPDRPIIAGAAPNPDTPSQVTAADQTMAKITTAGGNKIHLEDKQGSERILMHAPKQQSFVRIGAPNDPEWHDPWDPETGKETEDNYGIHIATSGLYDITVQAKNEVVLGETTEWVGGAESSFVAGAYFHNVLGGIIQNHWPASKLEFGNEHGRIEQEQTHAIAQINRISEQQLEVLGTATRTAGEQVTALGEATRVAGEQTEALGEATRVAGEQTEALGEATRVAGETTEALGASTRVAGEKTEALGAATRLAGEATDVLNSKITTIAEEVKTVLESAKIYQNSDEIVGMKIIV